MCKFFIFIFCISCYYTEFFILDVIVETRDNLNVWEVLCVQILPQPGWVGILSYPLPLPGVTQLALSSITSRQTRCCHQLWLRSKQPPYHRQENMFQVPGYLFLIFLPFSQILVKKTCILICIHTVFLFYFQSPNFVPLSLTNMRNKVLAVEKMVHRSKLLHNTAVMGKGLLLRSETMFWRSQLKFKSKQQLWVSLNIGN